MTSKLDDPLLTLEELAEYLGMSRSTLYNRRYRGESLPRSIRVGGRIRFRESDVIRWLDERADDPEPAAS